MKQLSKDVVNRIYQQFGKPSAGIGLLSGEVIQRVGWKQSETTGFEGFIPLHWVILLVN